MPEISIDLPEGWLAPHASLAPPTAHSAVDHPAHYGGADNPFEAIKVIEAWGLGFNLGNAVKYLSRAGHKDPAKTIEDLEKAVWYINREIGRAIYTDGTPVRPDRAPRSGA